MKDTPFKICTSCSKPWNTLNDFLSDPELKMNGYQVHFDDLEGGVFFFTHEQEGCLTTLAIPVKAFLPLNERPLLAKRDEQRCINSEFCVHQDDVSPHRPAKCECLWVRDILQTIRTWPKSSD